MKRSEDTLTRVEFQGMDIIWQLGGDVCAWDILERMDEPKPAYTTVATYLKVLYEKGYLDFHKTKGQGKTHRYVPLISKDEYTRRTMQAVKHRFFGGSVRSMLNYFVREEKLTAQEVQAMLSMVEEGGEV